MEIIIFDVEDAACALICSPNGYGMMIDCGCTAKNSDKKNPIDVIKSINEGKWMSMKPYVTQSKSYPLALLHITHPDDDHVRNSKRIHTELCPFLLQRIYTESFPDAETINDDYTTLFDKQYREQGVVIDWKFEEDKQFQIPMTTVKNDDELKKKIRNNASIIRYIKYAGKSILFAGDLEKPGWDWLAVNNSDFISTMQNGIDILIAPHHGHKSGFPKSLFELTGNVDVIIHSKGSEGDKDGTDVASQYSGYADGVKYQSLSDKKDYYGKVMTTRSNGNIFIKIDNLGSVSFWTEKGSSNHTI
ncbi:hypothetical protein AGMMS4957_21660 [Bacteroidia bacterium]|nr:hypothetical protein AGMMS4957_21660 [Bacteroidia bacterium]